MRTLIAVLASVAASTSPCFADSRPSWTGLYFGAQAGGGIMSGMLDGNYEQVVTNGGVPAYVNAEALATKGSGFAGLGAELVFGAHARLGRSWVIGAQIDGGVSQMQLGLTGTGSYTMGWGGVLETRGFPAAASIDLNWTAALVAKVGFLVTENTLVYAIGGWSAAGFSWASPRIASWESHVPARSQAVAYAPVVGGGLEFALTPNLSVKSEYRYSPFSEIDSAFAMSIATVPGTSNTYRSNATARADVQAVRIGFTFTVPVGY